MALACNGLYSLRGSVEAGLCFHRAGILSSRLRVYVDYGVMFDLHFTVEMRPCLRFMHAMSSADLGHTALHINHIPCYCLMALELSNECKEETSLHLIMLAAVMLCSTHYEAHVYASTLQAVRSYDCSGGSWQANMQAGRLESTLTLFIHTAPMHPVITVWADLELHRFCPVLPGFLPL